jgi:hypothetical protein
MNEYQRKGYVIYLARRRRVMRRCLFWGAFCITMALLILFVRY